MPARLTVAIAHAGGFAGNLELHFAAKTAALVDLLATHLSSPVISNQFRCLAFYALGSRNSARQGDRRRDVSRLRASGLLSRDYAGKLLGVRSWGAGGEALRRRYHRPAPWRHACAIEHARFAPYAGHDAVPYAG